jgi:tyrosine-protein kinase Etk/Wzc
MVENQKNNRDTTEFTVYEYTKIFSEHKKNILIITILAMIVSIIVAFFIMEPKFQSVAVVKTTTKSSGLSSLLGASASGMADLGDLGDLTGGSASKELALYENILSSRRNIEEVLIKFKLNDEWEFKYFQDAIKNFRTEVLEIKKDKMAGTLEIGILDKDPQRAKEMAEFMITQLNKINIDLNVQNAKNNRVYIEERYNISRVNLKKAEDSLKSYQDIYGIAPELQTKAVTEAEIKLEADVKTEEVKLDLLKKILNPDQSEVKMQEEKISAMKKQYEEIKNSNDPSSTLRLKGKPDIIVGYLRRVREVEIQNKIMLFLLPLYEQAKIEENKQMPSVLILDQPFVPEKKAKPKRINIVLISIFFALFSSYSFFVVKEKWNLYKRQNHSV